MNIKNLHKFKEIIRKLEEVDGLFSQGASYITAFTISVVFDVNKKHTYRKPEYRKFNINLTNYDKKYILLDVLEEYKKSLEKELETL